MISQRRCLGMQTLANVWVLVAGCISPTATLWGGCRRSGLTAVGRRLRDVGNRRRSILAGEQRVLPHVKHDGGKNHKNNAPRDEPNSLAVHGRSVGNSTFSFPPRISDRGLSAGRAAHHKECRPNEAEVSASQSTLTASLEQVPKQDERLDLLSRGTIRGGCKAVLTATLGNFPDVRERHTMGGMLGDSAAPAP
jgi:hypothetical protein